MRVLPPSQINNQDQPNYFVDFSGESQNYCVGIVDIVNSTKISASLPQKKMSKYYEIFLNSMANIVEKFSGYVIKNVGDSILYVFPESAKTSLNSSFLSCLECNLHMIDLHESINKKTYDEDLPELNYRVSSDYGKVTIIKSNNSFSIDLLGIPVNICAKINGIAPLNSVIIGSDLYQLVKIFDDYHFKEMKSYSIGLKYSYPIYLVSRKIH